MTSPTKRRPLPALVCLLALCLLTALVWWRVINRDSSSADSTPTCPTTQSTAKQLPEPQAISVTVLNATKRNGIAGIARAALLKDGFQIPAAAANDTAGTVIPQTAEIRYGPTGADGAKLLAYYFPGAKLIATQAADSTVVVSLGAKYTSVAAKTTVAATLKADGITLKATSGTPVGTASGSTNC